MRSLTPAGEAAMERVWPASSLGMMILRLRGEVGTRGGGGKLG